MSAKLIQISVNPNGGVPKYRVESARLGFERVEGDKQVHLKFHGGPMRAVCLFSLELIEQLRAEGHPIAPGTTGENLTISGLDWDSLRSGVRLQIGAAEIEITKYTTPCNQISESFSDGDSNRIGQKKHPGWSRLYAKVLKEGVVREGDAVEIVPGILTN